MAIVLPALKRVPRQPLCGRGVGVRQQRRNILRRALIFEAVQKIFLRKIVRRIRLVAQQVAHSVVVLAVCQPPHLVARDRAPQRASGRQQHPGDS